MARKILVALVLLTQVVVGIGPAEAQTGDPLGLIASAAIIPFWAAGSFLTVFELTSLGENPDMHAFFFAANCSRVFSIPFRMSAHDAAIVGSDELHLTFNGLVAFTKSVDNISPIALDHPITLRAHRVDFAFDDVSVVDPISAANAEDLTRTWNPLRSAATTITFPNAPPFTATRWWVVCLRNDVAVDLGGGIPPLPAGANLIRFRAYDLDENPVFDQQFNCNCLTEVVPGALNALFNAEARYVEMVTYVADKPIDKPPAFVLYRELRFGPFGGFFGEDFGRAPGMSAATLISGTPFQLAR